MSKKDFQPQPNLEFPWRIELCVKLEEHSIRWFTGASPDLCPEDAKKQGYLLLNRFMAQSAILTPIIVDKTWTPEKIEAKTKELTMILTPIAPKEESITKIETPLGNEKYESSAYPGLSLIIDPCEQSASFLTQDHCRPAMNRSELRAYAIAFAELTKIADNYFQNQPYQQGVFP
jgi:hypothetical protein